MSKTKLHVDGMHCASCEMLLEKELRKIKGVYRCHASHKKGEVDIEYKGDLLQREIQKAVNRCGYQAVGKRKKNKKQISHKNTFNDYLEIAMITVGVIAGVFLLNKIEIARFFPDFGSQVNIAIALILGVVASVSTCLALVGGIVLSFGSMYPVSKNNRHPFLSRTLPHLYFHVGRIGGFALLGGILGLIGSKINYSVSFTGYLTIVIAVVMIYIGLQILGLVPNITKLGFHLPKGLSQKIDTLQGSNHALAPILIGVLTFFLPCGFTQTMQLAAVTSQNFFTGALIMGAFAIGTMPALLSIGVGSTYAQKGDFNFFNKLIGVVIIFFAFYSLNSGLVLSGSSFTLNFWKSPNTAHAAVISGDTQIVKMDVDWVFKPNEFKIKKGVPVRWDINGINVSGCSNEVVIPKLNIRKKINKGSNIVEFTPTEEGIIPFSCWMGMLNGRFIVTDEKGGFSEVSENEIEKELNQPIPQGTCGGGAGGCGCTAPPNF